MARILTVELFRDGKRIKVNADDTLRFCKDGWERKKVNKQTTDPDLLAANAEADKAEAEGKKEEVKQDDQNTEPEVLNLDDLQAE